MGRVREEGREEILRPCVLMGGVDAPLVASVRSMACGDVNQVRGPAIYEEDGAVYLLYAVARESAVAIAQIDV